MFSLSLQACVSTFLLFPFLCLCRVTCVRLVEPESGVLRIDGVDVRAMGLKDLRTHMGVIPQDPVLFKVGYHKSLEERRARGKAGGGRRMKMCL